MSLQTSEKETMFSAMLQYAELKEKEGQVENQELERKFKLRTQKILEFHERQVENIKELKKRLEYISNHAHTIGAALRGASSDSASVPLSNALIKSLIQIRLSMEGCIRNAHLIKNGLAANYQPLMDNLLAKMEQELYNWSKIVNSATQALVNSRAFLENIQNLLHAQTQLCSEVQASDLFQSAVETTSDVEFATPSKSLVTVVSEDNQRCQTPKHETADEMIGTNHASSTPFPTIVLSD